MTTMISKPDDPITACTDVVVLGSTGSIGTQALQVLEGFKAQFRLLGLSAGANATLLAEQAARYQPKALALTDARQLDALKRALPGFSGPIFSGADANASFLAWCDAQRTESSDFPKTVPKAVVGIAGIAGLLPTLCALKQGWTVLTANKETLVTACVLIRPYLDQILPLDSEHNALFQCLQGHPPEHVASLTLTASGGPFLNWSAAQMAHATPQQALRHPKWQMGPKVTIDSATLMNKGLEVIEANVLFGLPAEQIDVAIHPQSTAHGAITFIDGSMLAHLGPTDMRLAIQHGLFYPGREALRLKPAIAPLALSALGQLTFEPPDLERFPCLGLAYEALKAGPGACIALNAADELMVQAFLDEKITLPQIALGIESVLNTYRSDAFSRQAMDSYEAILALDAAARDWGSAFIAKQTYAFAKNTF